MGTALLHGTLRGVEDFVADLPAAEPHMRLDLILNNRSVYSLNNRLDEEVRGMRNVIYSCAMSLVAYIAGPNGEYDWIIMDPDIDFAE